MRYKKLCMSVVLLIILYVNVMFLLNIRTVWQGIDEIEDSVSFSISCKDCIHRIYGYACKYLTPNEVDRIVKDDDNYLQLCRVFNSNADFSTRNIEKLRKVCQENGADFLYVSYPHKSDYSIGNEYGVEDNGLELRNDFLSKLNENGVKVYNMLPEFDDDPHNIFYKTDHHWTTDAGFKAAQLILRYLYDNGYDVDPDVLDSDKFERKVYKDLWIGETGRKYTEIWTETLDDFVTIKPKYDTNLSYILSEDYNKSGDFSILTDDDMLTHNFDLYTTNLHYYYMPDMQRQAKIRDENDNMPNARKYAKIINHDKPDKAKILIIIDSFTHPVAPFLSLGCSEIVWWDCRENPESLFECIENNDFDLVMAAHTDYWLDMVYDYH